jgi:hypothetical protein
MGDAFTFFIIILLILAVLTRETFVMVLLYLFLGASLLGRWWTGQVVNRMVFSRKYDHKVFPGELIPVRLDIHNNSWLPAVWVRVQDLFPIEVTDSGQLPTSHQPGTQ